MTALDIPAALRSAAQHVRERRTLDITEALVVAVPGAADLASVTAAFGQWLEMTLGEAVELHAWARSLPVPSTLADYLTHAARDIAACPWCNHLACDQREEHRRLNAQRETSWREPALPPPQVEAADVQRAAHFNLAEGVSAGAVEGAAPAWGECAHGCETGVIWPTAWLDPAPPEPCPDHYEAAGLAMEDSSPAAAPSFEEYEPQHGDECPPQAAAHISWCHQEIKRLQDALLNTRGYGRETA